MTNIEIGEAIAALETEKSDFISKGIFVLNKRMTEIDNEIRDLQSKCSHDFDSKGVCRFCHKI